MSQPCKKNEGRGGGRDSLLLLFALQGEAEREMGVGRERAEDANHDCHSGQMTFSPDTHPVTRHKEPRYDT
eukprot:scaffold14834_cov159-Skeletonema_dohrnii-CCMP3373.AAC.5